MTAIAAAPQSADHPGDDATDSVAQPPASTGGYHVTRAGAQFRAGILAALIACLTLVAFAPAVGFDFVSYDDPHYIYENAQVRRGLTWAGVSWAFTTGQAGNYHPLTWLSLMLDRSLFGDSARGFHRTNVLLHAVNAALLLLALRALTGSTWRSAAVALVWAIHPLRAESVAWATERKDVLAGFFGLLTLLAYARFADRPSWRRYAIVFIAFEFCLLSKSAWVTLPAVLLLLDCWPLKRIDRATVGLRMREKLPLLGLSLIACAATILMQRRGDAIGSLDRYPLLERLGNAVVAYATYLGKTVWPSDLAVFHPHRAVATAALAVSIVVLLGVTGVALWRRKTQPALVIGWLWFLGALVPMIGIVQSGAQARADRFTYLPMIGLLVGVAFALPVGWLASLRARAMAGVVVAAVCVALMVGTRRQLAHWRNSTSLFGNAVAVTRDNHVAHNSLAFEHVRAGRLDDARRHYEAALRIKPTYASALNGVGVVLARQGDAAGAIQQYERAIAAHPNFALAHRNLATQLLAVPGRERDGFGHLVRAVELSPGDARSNRLLGVELARRGDVSAALRHFETAVASDPFDADARVDFGRVLTETGRPDAALEQFEQALSLRPALSDAHYHAGEALVRLGRVDDAEFRFRECMRLTPDDADARAALHELTTRRQSSASVDPAR